MDVAGQPARGSSMGSDRSPGPIGGIDLGGTKIEARLFAGPKGETVRVRRVPTPGTFDAMVAAVAGQIGWLRSESGQGAMPVGVALPGVIDPVTGACRAANIPADGRRIESEIASASGRPVPLLNDAMAFALSEARGGAGEGARVVAGLIFGTGLGGGVAVDGMPPPRHAGLAMEIGHVGIPARALERHGLPLLTCGCGKSGCLEPYLSGTGIGTLSEHLLGTRLSGPDLARGEAEADAVLSLWADLAGDGLSAVQLLLDPEVIVIGGGLSNLPGIAGRLETSLARHALLGARVPSVRIARHGDSSGARGAALHAASLAEAGC